jgi:hypothetical protein
MIKEGNEMRSSICRSMASCLLLVAFIGASQATDASGNPVTVNMMIDVNMAASATQEQILAANSNMSNLYAEFDRRQLKGTIFPIEDITSSSNRLLVTQMWTIGQFELAMSGNHMDEKLSSLSYTDQQSLLASSKKRAEACYVCGGENVTIRGFLPQSFDQNQETYKALDDLGIVYNAGFQAGLIYAPGHENDVLPYLVESQKFYAVPISTLDQSGKTVPMVDRYFKENGLSGSQWYDALVAKFQEASSKDEPVVILLTTSISGSGDFLDALKKFLDYAKSNNAKFVTTMDLVSTVLPAGYQLPTPVPIPSAQSECPTCGNHSNASTNVASQVAPMPEVITLNMTVKPA